MSESPQSASPVNPAQTSSAVRIVLAFVALNAALRLPLLRLNGGEYTDGILQLIQFERADTFWPPLYTALAQALEATGLDGLFAGRLISWAASVALIPGLWALARRWSGQRGAVWTLALYTVSALSLRWSARVMTDMLFLCWFVYASEAWLAARRCEGRARARRVGAATVFAVLATLTRYQGALFAPLIVWDLFRLERSRCAGRYGAFAAQALWLALPAWLLYQRAGHPEFVERQAGTFLQTLTLYWYLFESFLTIVPYVLTLPVFALMVAGLVRGPSRVDAPPPLRGFFLYAALAILAAQSAFQSFQTRYLLPLLPFALVCAGEGAARLAAWGEAQGRGRRRLAYGLLAATLVVSGAFAGASLWLQREAFADVYAAGRVLGRDASVRPETPVYSNETYRPGIHGVKMGYVAGREVLALPTDPAAVPEGAVVALHSAYGGPAAQAAWLERFERTRGVRKSDLQVFDAEIVPLLPDVMERPGTHQNPLAWALRYQPQRFRTILFRVGPRTEQ